MILLSSEQAALLRAVCDNPEEDTPRLVYADWLQETGGEAQVARAEFIRLQIARARAGGPATREETHLLTRYHQSWSAERPDFSGLNVHDLVFDRGFPFKLLAESVQSFLNACPRLFSWVPITEIRFKSAKGRTADILARSPSLARIRHLDQVEYGWDDWILQYFASTPQLCNLRQFALGDCNAANAGLRAFLNNPSLTGLRELNLTKCPRLGPGLGAVVAECPSASTIEVIRLSWFPLGPASAFEMPALVRLPNLRELALIHTVIGREGAEALAATSTSNNLRLELGGNNITDRGGEALLRGPLLHSPTVTADLRINGFSDAMRTRLTAAFGKRVFV